MLGFKGLLPRQLLSDQSFQPILKKAEDYRKSTQISVDFFQQITKSFENYANICEKNIAEANKPQTPYYKQLINLFDSLTKENKFLVDSSNGSFRQLTALCNTIFLDFSNFILNFQQLVRNYQQSQKILFQLNKKYFRTHKTMITNIEAYKVSFTDVNLIYNIEEKTKRYTQCENTYKTAIQEHENILKKTQKLISKKAQIIKSYGSIEGQFSKVMKVIGSKIISETKNFVGNFCLTQKRMITVLADHKYQLQPKTIDTFFTLISLQDQNAEFFQGLPEAHEIGIPLIFAYHHKIKEQFLLNYNAELLNVIKTMSEKLEQRKVENKLILQCISNMFKIMNKNYQAGVKDIINFFQKIRKKLAEIFGNRLVSFIKSITSILELTIGINEKLIKRINSKLAAIAVGLQQENKLLKIFDQQFRSTAQKFIGKKEIKKIKEEQFSQQFVDINVKQFKKQIAQKSEFFVHLIRGFKDKMTSNYKKVKKNYEDVIDDLEASVNELFPLCCEYQELYFGSQQFLNNFKKYETDITTVLEKEKAFFDEINFGVLKKETPQITFDGQISKIQDFKKLKKPVDVSVESNKSIAEPNKTQDVVSVDLSRSSMNESMQNKTVNRQTISYEGKQEKYLEFLLTKVNFVEGETLIKTFACALANKIILQGRLYITNERMCFHSKFNSGNLFFGGTFIEIPKKDIKKIEKKINAIIFDNSISITTVNGQIFLTSFFSRNQAFDLLCKTFSINIEENLYEEEQGGDNNLPDFLLQLQEQNDMKENQIPERQTKINEMLQKFEYKEATSMEIKKQGLNALKILKIFYGNNEMNINRRTYPNFLLYFKQILEHKEVQINEWQPSLPQICNASNIKDNAPLKTTRVIKATVPIANTGVPFMPKTASSTETQNLYIISKHKWIIEATIETVGAPYTDTFRIQLKTEVESTNQGNCRIQMSSYLNFIKKTMMKKLIEDKTTAEAVAALKLFLEEMKKIIEGKDKKKKQKIQSNLQIQNELQQVLKEKQEMGKKIQQLQKASKLKDKYLVCGAVLNLILILILIS